MSERPPTPLPVPLGRAAALLVALLVAQRVPALAGAVAGWSAALPRTSARALAMAMVPALPELLLAAACTLLLVALAARLPFVRRMLRHPLIAGAAAVGTAAAVAALLPLASVRLWSAPPGGAEAPNVLLVVVDTLRADHVDTGTGALAHTPHVAALAAGGQVWTRARSQGSCTINGSPAIVFSRYASESGYFRYDRALPAEATSIAEVLAERGYQTWARSTNPHVSVANGFDQGFAGFEEDADWKDTDASQVVDDVLGWLDRRDPGAPFYAMAWFIDPHVPYDPPQASIEAALTAEQRARLEPRHGFPNRSESPFTDDDRALARTLYRLEVESWDDAFGRLLDGLEARGLRDDTVIIITSDHGELLWERNGPDGDPAVGHGLTLYREEIAVPLILAGPGVAPGRSDALVGNIDVPPTIAALVGLGPDVAEAAGFQGRALDLGAAPRDVLVSELVEEQYRDQRARAIEGATHKLVEIDRLEGQTFAPPRRELLAVDGPETPVAFDEATAAPLRQALDDWAAGLQPLTPEASVLAPGQREGVEAQLRALGYME
ncbi:MAG: sulfatase [Alphaproteobacteria bacterium]|nr:sulfatase [Alphaproteobacteria bacterium]